MKHFSKKTKLAAIAGIVILELSVWGMNPAKAEAQTQTGWEFEAEQVALTQYSPRFAAIANTLTACDVSVVGVGFVAHCSIRFYAGQAGDFSAYHSTMNVTCKSFMSNSGSQCSVQEVR